MKISEDEFASFGKLLIKIQFFETLLKIFISLFNDEIKAKNPSIKNLSSKDILDDSVLGRKQTLGVLIKVIKKEIPLFDNKEFIQLLEMRNTFIHKFHKEYLSRDNINQSNYMLFVRELWEKTDKYTDVFTGLINLSVKRITGKDANKLDLKGLEKSELYFYKYILEQD